MKTITNWNYHPYRPLDCEERSNCPFLSRIEPATDSILIEWFDTEEAEHTLYVRERYTGVWFHEEITAELHRLKALKVNTEYEFYIQRKTGVKSNFRLAKTGTVPGIVVNYLHPEDNQYQFSGKYLCSPSLVKLPSGALLASMDLFAGAHAQNLTVICRSDDGGNTWHYFTELFPCFWGKLFVHHEKLYMLGVSREYGDLLIGCSEDEGKTWSMPTVLARGACFSNENGIHRAPCVVLQSDGRLWTAVEYGSWSKNKFSNALYSVDENADLLNAANWVSTGFLPHNRNWENACNVIGAIEGNAVKAPNGDIINFLRYATNKALLLKTNPENPEEISFYKVIDFPMAHTKFEIIQHKNGTYYAVGNRLPLRNILSLYQSFDLEKWEFVKDILNYESYDTGKTAFQYPSFLIDGDEVLILSRTGFNGAANFHDSNYITFHKTTL